MIELTDVEQKIFEKVMKEWKKRGAISPEILKQAGYKEVDDAPISSFTPAALKRVIKMANVHGDGYKRVRRIGEDKVYLVPIENIILDGLKATELDKYPIEDRQ